MRDERGERREEKRTVGVEKQSRGRREAQRKITRSRDRRNKPGDEVGTGEVLFIHTFFFYFPFSFSSFSFSIYKINRKKGNGF